MLTQPDWGKLPSQLVDEADHRSTSTRIARPRTLAWFSKGNRDVRRVPLRLAATQSSPGMPGGRKLQRGPGDHLSLSRSMWGYGYREESAETIGCGNNFRQFRTQIAAPCTGHRNPKCFGRPVDLLWCTFAASSCSCARSAASACRESGGRIRCFLVSRWLRHSAQGRSEVKRHTPL